MSGGGYGYGMGRGNPGMLKPGGTYATAPTPTYTGSSGLPFSATPGVTGGASSRGGMQFPTGASDAQRERFAQLSGGMPFSALPGVTGGASSRGGAQFPVGISDLQRERYAQLSGMGQPPAIPDPYRDYAPRSLDPFNSLLAQNQSGPQQMNPNGVGQTYGNQMNPAGAGQTYNNSTQPPMSTPFTAQAPIPAQSGPMPQQPQMIPGTNRPMPPGAFIDEYGIARRAPETPFNPGAGQFGQYGNIQGDGFTGTRGGQNFVNGNLFAAEGLNQGGGPQGLGVGFGNWLNKYGPMLNRR